jgi:predicted transcriptional regulator
MTDREAVKQKIKALIESKEKNLVEIAFEVCMHPTTLSRVVNDKGVRHNTIRRLYKELCSSKKTAG